MSIVVNNGAITLVGACGVEEAETLVGLILGNPGVPVDVGAADRVHTALWQVLLALAPPVKGEPRDPVVKQWIASGFTANRP